MKINCWKLEDGNEVPMLSTATLDGFEWNGKFRITVTDDDGSLGLPFLFAAYDTAILTVEASEQDGMGTDDKKIKQVISCVPRSLGNEITCSRIRSYNGKEHVWSAWETISSAGGIKVDWGAYSSVDTFITAGIYNIRGERLNVNDGLPIANSNPGHTINARLVVIDSSISGTGDIDDKCITQILTLSNRTGGDGDVYIRTGRAQSTNMLAGGSGWEPWGKLQQNIEVGQVTSLNSFIGNGIYSGVYTNGSSFFETFVMVVINNYAVAGATGNVRSVSQFKYALNVDSTFSYKTRTGRGNTGIEWGSWVDLGAATTTDIQDNSITAQKLSSDVREKVDNPLRPLFIAAGAEYNDTGADITKTAPWGETVTHKAGHYYLNGLGDITEEQMCVIVYKGAALTVQNNLLGYRGRTNAYLQGTYTSELDGYYWAYDCGCEVINLGTVNPTGLRAIKMISTEGFVGNNAFLKHIIGGKISFTSSSISKAAFSASRLETVNIDKLNKDISFYMCVNLSKESVIYMIQNAAPTTAITVTLHADAYARLADDADVVAALEAQPLISLVSA